MIMPEQFFLTAQAERQRRKLSPALQDVIEKKLIYFFTHDPLRFAVPVVNLPPATHRFRIGKMRITFFRRDGKYYVVSIRSRDKIYRV